MIAPFDIDRMIMHKGIHYDMRTGTPVEDITHQMQMIHRRPFDQLADLDDEFRRLPDLDDRGDDVFKVVALVHLFAVGIEQLLQDIGEARVLPLVDKEHQTA